MKRTELASFLTYLCLFFLPWQTVWIYDSVSPSPLTPLLMGEGEYWKLTHYAVQLLIIIAVLVRGRFKVSPAGTKIIKVAWLFFTAVLLSCVLSVNWYLSSAFLFHLFFALLLFWLLFDERISARKAVWFFVGGLAAPALLGWWQVLTNGSPTSTLFGLTEHLAAVPGTSVVEMAGDRLLRAYGTFAHPNIFGGYLAAVMAAIVFQSSSVGTTRELSPPSRPWLSLRAITIIKMIVIAITAATLVITFSRSAWLALLFGIISFFVVSAVARKKISRRFVAGLVVVAVSFVLSVAFFHNAVFARIVPIERLEAKSLIERQSEYQTILEMVKINPFTGIGPGAYTWALAEKYPDQPVWSYQPMHNSILLLFAELGLLGFVFLVNFLWSIFKAIQQNPSVLQGLNALTPPIAVLTTLSLLDHYLWSQWAGLALAAVVLAIFTRNLDKN